MTSAKYAFTDVVPSPDGSMIALTYVNPNIKKERHAGNLTHIAIYMTATGEMKHIPNPDGHMLMHPNFSHDGRKMLFGVATRNAPGAIKISEYDIASSQHKIIYEYFDRGNFPSYPTYYPKTNTIIFFNLSAESVGTFELVSYDPHTGKRVVLIDKNNGFGIVSRPSFLSDNRIIFQAGQPANSNLENEIKRTPGFYSGKFSYDYRLDVSRGVSYDYTFGNDIKILSPELESDKTLNMFSELNGLSASYISKQIIFARGITEMFTDKNPKILRELYSYNNGNPTKLTNNKSFITNPSISFNGNVVAMIADFNQPRVFDVYLYNVKNKTLLNTNALAKITNSQSQEPY